MGRDYGVTMEVLKQVFKSRLTGLCEYADSMNEGKDLNVKEVDEYHATDCSAPGAASAPKGSPKPVVRHLRRPAGGKIELMPLDRKAVPKRLCNMGHWCHWFGVCRCTVGAKLQEATAPVPRSGISIETFSGSRNAEQMPFQRTRGGRLVCSATTQMNRLETDLLVANIQNLKVSVANYQQARASAAVGRTHAFPTVVVRHGKPPELSGDRATVPAFKLPARLRKSSWRLPVTVSYEVDPGGAAAANN